MDREVPLDLDRSDFSKALWGYNMREVRQLVRMQQNQLLNAKQRVQELEQELARRELYPSSAPVPAIPTAAETPLYAAPAPAPEVPAVQPVIPVAAPAPAPQGKSDDEVEVSLREIFVMAQKTADETRAKAKREAAKVLEEAQMKAEEQTREYRAEASQLKWDIERLRLDKQKLVDEYRGFLEGRLASLSDSSRAFVGGTPAAVPQVHVHPIVTPEEANALLDETRDAS